MRSTLSFVLLAGVLSLSACNGTGTTRTGSLIPSQPNGAAARERGGASSIAGDAATRDLLYVSNRKDGSVDVFAYPAGTPEGSLLGVHASGLCSDSDGNVFIPAGNRVLEFAHADARPLATLPNPIGGDAQFCAVDPATGDLAVSGGHGIAIYAGAKGAPKTAVDRDSTLRYGSAAYDGKGNLFIEVAARAGSANLVELPKGAVRVESIAWEKRPNLGSIQWDGKYLAAESPQRGAGATILRYDISGKQAVPAGKIVVADAGNPMQFSIAGGRVVVPGDAGVTVADYPSGERSVQIGAGAREPQAAAISAAKHRKIAVTTYHYNNMRTGWDDQETILNQTNVRSNFGLLHAVALDDQVDTQPLLVANEVTTRGSTPGKHDVVYVTTENDSVYAIDATTGTVLFQQSLGTPVPYPLGCNNNGPNVGIDGTPVIDKKANVMYVVAYVMQSNTPKYYIHELSLANLTDVISPVLVTASHKLTNGKTYNFNAEYQRQRPALLEANGNIYAGFGSFCDFNASQSRGWLLGWQAGTLTPLAANRLNDALSSSQDNFFLSAIWMSGYGPAADSAGNVYFVTGNSDYSGNSYDPVNNVAESVVKVSGDLTQLLSVFTPSDESDLDESDADFGSGGVMLLPKSAARLPLAVAAGKEGTMFLMNRKNLGGYNPSGSNHVLDSENIGGCWCGPSYFGAASDGTPRIVGSGGNTVTVWKVEKSHGTKLVMDGYSQGLPGGQDPGFFTAISSNGHAPGAIIWALARPDYVPGNITLFAFAADPPSSELQTLFQGTAGSWGAAGGNANLVPVVANGQVYVASFEQLDIFGLIGTNGKRATPLTAKAELTPAGAPHEVTGTLVALKGSQFTLRTRTGNLVRVDGSDAAAHERSVLLVAGEAFDARGVYDAGGVLHASAIVRAKPAQSMWPADR
ncbi:MAG TPA: hypothetical protein VMU38_06850 [Candidatus Binatia bacterium]|nr:hypothetical protein [Candidatus Binatia bacterium]